MLAIPPPTTITDPIVLFDMDTSFVFMGGLLGLLLSFAVPEGFAVFGYFRGQGFVHAPGCQKPDQSVFFDGIAPSRDRPGGKRPGPYPVSHGISVNADLPGKSADAYLNHWISPGNW